MIPLTNLWKCCSLAGKFEIRFYFLFFIFYNLHLQIIEIISPKAWYVQNSSGQWAIFVKPLPLQIQIPQNLPAPIEIVRHTLPPNFNRLPALDPPGFISGIALMDSHNKISNSMLWRLIQIHTF